MPPETNLPIIFIHGSFANSNSWRKISDLIDDFYQYGTINLPGHGGLPDPDDFQKPSFQPEFKKIKEILKQSPNMQDGVHLVGHSFGAVVALACSLNSSLPIKKLTLFEPVDVSVLTTFSKLEALKTVTDFIDSYKHAHNNNEKHACARVIDLWGGTGSFDAIPSHIQAAMADMTQNNLRHWELCKNNPRTIKQYEELNIPVVLVHGSKSNPVAINIAKSLNDHLPNSSIHEIADASHFMITSHPKECAKILLNAD